MAAAAAAAQAAAAAAIQQQPPVPVVPQAFARFPGSFNPNAILDFGYAQDRIIQQSSGMDRREVRPQFGQTTSSTD
jgi:hypothetical protein